LTKRIDEIALAMIDETKKCQEKYIQDLKENLLENSSPDESKLLEDEIRDIEDTFRFIWFN
jgi:hypothetical protein